MTCLIRHNQIPMALRLAVFTSVLVGNAFVMAAGKEDLIRDEAHAGIHKKLIIATDVALYDKPDGTTAETLNPFEIYFQLWPSDDAKNSKKEDQNGWVRIGFANGKERGWIKNSKSQKGEDPFYSWLTRFMLEPRTPPDPQSPKFHVDFLLNGKPVFAEFAGEAGGKSGGDRKAIAPILDDTTQEDKFKVAFFLGKPAKQTGAGPVAQEELSAKDLKDTSVDLVFVIDTTASMTPLIEATKDVVKQCVAALKQANPEVRQATRFGLVAYQDATPGLKPVEIVCKLSDANTFQQKLEQLGVATQGSEEVPEDVLAGLTAAIGPDMGWNTMAFKHVMLIGDASAHLTGPKNTTGKTIESVMEGARNQSGGEAAGNLASVTFNTVRAKQPGNDPAEDQLCKEQFQQIAQNQGRLPGFSADIDPNNPTEKSECVAAMVVFYKSALEALGGLKSGNMKVIANVAGRQNSAPASQMYTFSMQVQPDDLSPVAEGTASDRDASGNLVATKKVFVSKSDIKRLSSVLSFLYDSLKQSNDAGERGDVAIVMNTLQTAVALTAAGEKGTQFDKSVSLKAVISELPLKSDALEITIQELAAMPDDAFTEWLAKLESTKRTAAGIADLPDDQWMQLDDGTDRSDDLLFRPLRIEELP